ncbi:hypothetical protein SDC9_129953 [bioreactor metagenome]|uniref:Uncharacterized protein n=1 Tax=bioreactor metagenome TaxID=1076179 RepID=A0A645D1A4_9ZZZZ
MSCNKPDFREIHNHSLKCCCYLGLGRLYRPVIKYTQESLLAIFPYKSPYKAIPFRLKILYFLYLFRSFENCRIKLENLCIFNHSLFVTLSGISFIQSWIVGMVVIPYVIHLDFRLESGILPECLHISKLTLRHGKIIVCIKYVDIRIHSEVSLHLCNNLLAVRSQCVKICPCRVMIKH